MDAISKVVIGTWPLSGDFGNVSLKTVEESLEYCYENGLKEFDTAPNYGNGFAEIALGKVFSGMRDVVVNTKVGNTPFRGKNFAVDSLRASLDESLKRLSVESVGTLFLHNPRGEVDDYDGLLSMMNELKSSGLIRSIGISLAKGFPYPEEVLAEFDEVQHDVNLLYREALDLNLSGSTRLVARSPLASGVLSGQLASDKVYPLDDCRSDWLKGERLASLLKRVAAIQEVAPDLSVAFMARKFLLQESRVDKIIFGISCRSHVVDLLRDIERPDLSVDVLALFEKLYSEDFGLVCEGDLGF